MIRQREKMLAKLFRNYRQNKTELETDYNIPVPSGIAYDKIKVQADTSKNTTYESTISYISKREELFKKVFIVEEVLNWFKLEGHGRERFICMLMVDGCSWTKAEMQCHVSLSTLSRWREEVLEKAETVAKWVNFF